MTMLRLALAFLSSLPALRGARADDAPASPFLPARPWLVVELRDAPGFASGLERSAAWSSIGDAALALAPDANDGRAKLAALQRALARAGGGTSLAALGELLGPRALYWVEGLGAWGLVLSPRDPRLVARTLREIVRELEPFPAVPRLQEFHCAGAPGWSLGTELHLLRAGESYLLGPRRELVERAYERARRSTAPSRSVYAPGDVALTGTASGATLWLDGELVRRSEGVAKLPEQLREPMANLLLGSYLAPLLVARPLRIELSWSEDLATLHGVVHAGDTRGLEEYWRGLCAPPAPAFAVPSFARAESFLARVRLQRDWARWWREKDSRWSDAGRAGIRDLEQLLALLLKGEDFAAALAEVEGPLELLLVEPRFEGVTAPAHRYPAAALVIGLARAERGEVFERAFRALLGISNAERVKRDLSSMSSSAVEEGGFRVVRAAWPEGAPELERVEGNLSPCFARCAHVVVFASSVQALDAALGVLRGVPHAGDGARSSEGAAHESRGDLLELDWRALARLLAANREALAFARVLDQGEELARAERTVESFLALAERLERMRLALRLDQAGARAVLDFELRLSEPGR